MRLVKGIPNPHGAEAVQLFLLVGGPTAGPVSEIRPDPGITLPDPYCISDGPPFRLKILHLNDLHGHMSRFTQRGDQPVFSRMVWRMRQVRQERLNDPRAAVLTLSAGDDLGGAVFDELLGDDPDSYILHAGYRLYSQAGVDVGVLGNHDLDMGARLLAHAIRREARFPLLAANLTGANWLDGLYHPAALLVTKGLRIGIIGLITGAEIKPQLNTELQIADPIKTVHHLLPALRPLCDVLIILSHLGYSLETNPTVVSQAGDVELARSLPPGAVQLIVGGHTHHVLNEQGLSAYNIINDIPIVQAGTLGHHLGEVDITIRKSAAVTNTRLTLTAYLPVDEAFERAEVQPLVEMVRPVFTRKLGRISAHPDLETEAVRNTFAAGESAMANFITDAMVTRCRANGYPVDLAILDAPNVRTGLPIGGELSFGDWFNVMPFADAIRLYTVTGHQLKELLNDNARRADRPGEPHTERGFLHFSRQVRYTIVLGQGHETARAINIKVNDLSIEEQLERSFHIAASSFVRQAAIPWEKCIAQSSHLSLVDIHTWPRRDTTLLLRDELIIFIRDNGGVTEQGGARHDGRVQILEIEPDHDRSTDYVTNS